jgi:hypothetical protein
MSENEDYNMKIEIIKAIPDDQIKIPNSIPLGTYIMEAYYLHTWCQDDKEELTSKGLDWTVVEDMPIRCEVLSDAVSNWTFKKSQRMISAKDWLHEAPDGFDLRNELVHHFRYAFRDYSSLILRVSEISKRITQKGMIKGLRDLSVLGKANRDLLTKIGFDLTLLDMAGIKADEYEAKCKEGSWDREDYREAKKFRNQAYTHLKEAVDYIREYGKFVFWKDAHRLKGYRSSYLRKIRLRNNRRKKLSIPVTESEHPDLKQ